MAFNCNVFSQTADDKQSHPQQNVAQTSDQNKSLADRERGFRTQEQKDAKIAATLKKIEQCELYGCQPDQREMLQKRLEKIRNAKVVKPLNDPKGN